MRLTVHLTNVNKKKVLTKTPKGEVMKEIIYNTLSFNNIKEKDVSRILNDIENSDNGKPTKYYTTNTI